MVQCMKGMLYSTFVAFRLWPSDVQFHQQSKNHDVLLLVKVLCRATCSVCHPETGPCRKFFVLVQLSLAVLLPSLIAAARADIHAAV
jgi:hypothetical protein